jgi:hypothetical protein
VSLNRVYQVLVSPKSTWQVCRVLVSNMSQQESARLIESNNTSYYTYIDVHLINHLQVLEPNIIKNLNLGQQLYEIKNLQLTNMFENPNLQLCL